MFLDLKGRTALVTGGSGGLGYAMAESLARSGMSLALVDMADDVAESAHRLASEHGVPTTAVSCDVTDRAAVQEAFSQVDEALGSVDVLVNCAGISVMGDSLDIPASVMRRVFDVNVVGTLHCAQELANRCRAGKRAGNIINIASMSSFIVNVPQQQMPYNVSKAAVSMLTKCLAIEWLPIGVRVNAIAPGYFASSMTRQYVDKNEAIGHEWVSRIPIGRMGQPDELGGLVTYLASDESGYMIGQTIVIDGGYTIV